MEHTSPLRLLIISMVLALFGIAMPVGRFPPTTSCSTSRSRTARPRRRSRQATRRPLCMGLRSMLRARSGRGICQSDGDELLYDAKDNANIASGAIALWGQAPWGGMRATRLFRFWFRAAETAGGGGKGMDGGVTFLWFYKYGGGALTWLVQQNYRQVASVYVRTEKAFLPGQWTHLAASWCGPVMRLLRQWEIRRLRLCGYPLPSCGTLGRASI